MTSANITLRVQEFLPLALFVFFLSYVAFEVIHLIHSPGWKWKRTAKGCLEAFAFFILSMPIILGVSFLSNRISDRFNFDPLEAGAIRRWLAFLVLIPLLLYWNGRRWRHLNRNSKTEIRNKLT